MPIGSARTRNLSKTLFQAPANLRPRDKRRTIAIEILLGLWLALYRCHFLLSFTFFLHVDPGLQELLTWYLQTSSLEVLIRYPSAPYLVVFAWILRGVIFFEGLQLKPSPKERAIKFHRFAGVVLKVEVGVQFCSHRSSFDSS